MPDIFTTPSDWLTARKALLEREKAHTRARDALAKERRALPRLAIDTPYMFDTLNGSASLVDLFGDKSQLIVYHFMFGEDWEEGCASCSFWADNLNGIAPHLAARDAALVFASTAPLDVIQAYKSRLGWTFDWVSCASNTFNHDFGVSFAPDAAEKTYNFAPSQSEMTELPGLSCFERDGEQIYLTYATYGRGLDHFNGAYQLLDLAPKGRDEDDLPWPMAWVQRRDQY